MDVRRVLARLPLFAELPAGALADVVASALTVETPAGQYLMEEGEPGDTLHVVVSGRCEIISPRGDRLRTMSTGDSVGELSLLTGARRSASVRALRDTTTLAIPRNAVIRLLEDHPKLLAEIAAGISRQLAAGPQTTPGQRPVICVESTHRSLDPLLDKLVRQLFAGRLDESSAPWPERLDALERAHELVVLACPVDAGAEWLAFARRCSDRRVVLATDLAPPAATPTTCDVLALALPLGSPWPAWAGEWKAARRHRLSPAGHGSGVLARRLAGSSVGAVLSGGGARGLAHVGVFLEWERAGVWPDRWGGTSMGAFIAALAATGRTAREISGVAGQELVSNRPFRDYAAVPRHSLLKGQRARQMLDRVFGDTRIEDLTHDFFCVSVDLVEGELVVHRSGRLVDAVAASMSIPGMVAPLALDGKLLVDGGVLDNLPVDVMAELAEGPVVAVDVMRHGLAVDPGTTPGVLDTIGRAMGIGGWARTVRNLEAADLVIAPELTGIGLLDFDTSAEAVRRGRAAGEASVPELKQLMTDARSTPTAGQVLSQITF